MNPYAVLAILIVGLIAVAVIGISNESQKKKKEQEKLERAKQLKEQYDAVIKTSQLIANVRAVQEQYPVDESVKNRYAHTFYVNSRQAVDNFDFHKNILGRVEELYDSYSKIYTAIMQNRMAYDAVIDEIENSFEYTPSPYTLDEIGVSESEYAALEADVIKFIKSKKPVTNSEFYFRVHYVSPKGKAQADDCESIMADELGDYLEEVDSVRKHRASAAYQRQLMNPKMRKMILDRDNHRCVICGRSAADGVKLHVDHIIPVSKGGKTVPSNLRTLCQDCNLGKGASYDPDGIN